MAADLVIGYRKALDFCLATQRAIDLGLAVGLNCDPLRGDKMAGQKDLVQLDCLLDPNQKLFGVL